MGLDMYLYGVTSNYNLHDYNLGNIKNFIDIGYWRKANQIHNWFVENIQGNVDNCATYCVDENSLKELKSLCVEVLRCPEKADEILPTNSGFFFGSQEYDDLYLEDIKRTIEIINYALSRDFDYFAYNSSW